MSILLRDITIIGSESHKFCYTKIGKNAGTSIHRGILDKQVKDLKLYRVDVLPEYAGYFNFTVIRNPWDRIVSVWNYFIRLRQANKKIPMCTFREFLEKDYVSYNWSIRMHACFQYNNIFKNGFIAKLENLENDWKVIAEKIGVTSRLPVKNVFKHKKYTEYYDDWCISKVNDLYKNDIEVLGYKFGE